MVLNKLFNSLQGVGRFKHALGQGDLNFGNMIR
jgi:hypothetical protein